MIPPKLKNLKKPLAEKKRRAWFFCCSNISQPHYWNRRTPICMCRHYYLPILTKDLVIEISDGEETELEINRDTLRTILDDLGDRGEKISNRCNFVDWIITGGQEDIVSLKFANTAGDLRSGLLSCYQLKL